MGAAMRKRMVVSVVKRIVMAMVIVIEVKTNYKNVQLTNMITRMALLIEALLHHTLTDFFYQNYFFRHKISSIIILSAKMI